MTPHDSALTKAKIALMTRPDSVFFSTVFFSLKHVWNTEIPAATTDGVSVEINPKYFVELDSESRVFLLVRMSMHVAYMHPLRTAGRDLKKFNLAAGHVVNIQLRERNFKYNHPSVPMPSDLQYKDMAVEQVYPLLDDEEENDDNNQPPPPDFVTPPGPEQDTTKLEQDVQEILVRAAMQSKMANEKPGSIPGDIELYLKKFLNPTLPWYQILHRYLKKVTKSDYSFKKPNKRHAPEFYLPSMIGESVIDLVMAPDVSGSCSDEDLQACMNEVAGVFKQLKPEKVTLLPFDTRIRDTINVKNVSELSKVVLHGRGGTDIEPVIHWANEHKPQVMIVFSDGEFDFPEVTTKVPVIWLIYNNPQFTAPYGKVIHYEVKH